MTLDELKVGSLVCSYDRYGEYFEIIVEKTKYDMLLFEIVYQNNVLEFEKRSIDNTSWARGTGWEEFKTATMKDYKKMFHIIFKPNTMIREVK